MVEFHARFACAVAELAARGAPLRALTGEFVVNVRGGTEANGADLVLIDMPGKNDNIAIGAVRLADLVLIPCHGLPSLSISCAAQTAEHDQRRAVSITRPA